jgi:sigma-B regulation protein RsbU (phosphoserine phosphatase)
VRALIADDDRGAVVILKKALERMGLDVIVAHDGSDAWETLQRDPGIALTVLDWMMPGVDGPEICRRIRADDAHAHMYVILLTSRDASADLVAGLDAGADDYLIKPIEAEELRARVQVGLRVHGLQEKLSEQVAELQAALSRVKQLTGLLPICSYCKSVRTDQNYWERVDHYMTQHTDVQFSHGICPACYEIVTARLDQEEAESRAALQQPPATLERQKL